MQKITAIVSILTLAVTSVLWTAEANAGRRDDRGHNTHNQQPTHFNAHRGHDRDRGGYHRGRGGHRDSYRHHNRRGYTPYVSHYGAQRGYRGRVHHRRHHSGGGVVLGLGLGIIANELMHSSHRHHNHHNHHDTHTTRVIHTDTVVRPYQNVRPAPSQANNGFDTDSCLQTREYQTVVVIGGKEVDAYGTACLQPDGSWLQGPAIVEPEF